MLREHKRVFYLPYEEFLDAQAPWGPVPDFKNISRSGVKAGQGPGREWKSPMTLAKEKAEKDEQTEKQAKLDKEANVDHK